MFGLQKSVRYYKIISYCIYNFSRILSFYLGNKTKKLVLCQGDFILFYCGQKNKNIYKCKLKLYFVFS